MAICQLKNTRGLETFGEWYFFFLGWKPFDLDYEFAVERSKVGLIAYKYQE